MKTINSFFAAAMVLMLGLSLGVTVRAELPAFTPSKSHCTDPKFAHVAEKLTPAQCDQWFKFETKHAKKLTIGYDGRLYLETSSGGEWISIEKLTDAEFPNRKYWLAGNIDSRFDDLLQNGDNSIDQKSLDEFRCSYDDGDCRVAAMDLRQKILAGQCKATDNPELKKLCESAKNNGNLVKLSDEASYCRIDGRSMRGESSCPRTMNRFELPFGQNILSEISASGGTCGDNHYFFGPLDAHGKRADATEGLCLEGNVFFRFAIGQAVPDILLPFYNRNAVMVWQKNASGVGEWINIGQIDNPSEPPAGDFDYTTHTKSKVETVLYKFRNINKRLNKILGDNYDKFEYGFGQSGDELVRNSDQNCIVNFGSVPHDRISRSYLQICSDQSIYLSYTDYLSLDQSSFEGNATNSNRVKSWVSALQKERDPTNEPIMSMIVYAPVDSIDQLPEPIKTDVTNWIDEFDDDDGFWKGKYQVILRKSK
ncbi:MAG: hypothetical protein QM523_11200 [Candidatus Pacebacteria bacterium]|nr:hypothetical protein [Candidatus Paceibacterota bacterium]